MVDYSSHETKSPSYYQEVLHGYLIQERVCRAYSVLLVGCKLFALVVLIIPLALLEFNIPASNTTALHLASLLGFISIIALGLFEKGFGKPVWQPSRAKGLRNWEFESKYSCPTFRR